MPFIPGSHSARDSHLCCEKPRRDETWAQVRQLSQEPSAPAHGQRADSFPSLELHIPLAARYGNMSAAGKGKQITKSGPCGYWRGARGEREGCWHAGGLLQHWLHWLAPLPCSEQHPQGHEGTVESAAEAAQMPPTWPGHGGTGA